MFTQPTVRARPSVPWTVLKLASTIWGGAVVIWTLGRIAAYATPAHTPGMVAGFVVGAAISAVVAYLVVAVPLWVLRLFTRREV